MSVQEFKIKHRYLCDLESNITLPENRTTNDIENWQIRHHTFECTFADGETYSEELWSDTDEGIDWTTPYNYLAIDGCSEDDRIVSMIEKCSPFAQRSAVILTKDEISNLIEFIQEGINQISHTDCEASKHLDFAGNIIKTLKLQDMSYETRN